MNDRTPLTDITEATAPSTNAPRLQTLDFGALGIGNAADQLLVCDIDDPDCELPEGIAPATRTGTADDEA